MKELREVLLEIELSAARLLEALTELVKEMKESIFDLRLFIARLHKWLKWKAAARRCGALSHYCSQCGACGAGCCPASICDHGPFCARYYDE